MNRSAPLQRKAPVTAKVPVPKVKRCKACKAPFVTARPLQRVCSIQCAADDARAKREKVERQADQQKRLALKPRSWWVKEAQEAFNRFIRLRDAALPCISCGRHHGGKWNAGHYLSTGARPELRFDEQNVHKQCEPCNTFLSGNLVLYRAELIRRCGLEVVERLEALHATRHYSIDDLRAIRATYKRRARELGAQR